MDTVENKLMLGDNEASEFLAQFGQSFKDIAERLSAPIRAEFAERLLEALSDDLAEKWAALSVSLDVTGKLKEAMLAPKGTATTEA